MVAVRQQLLKRMQKKTPKRTVDLTREVLSDALNERGHGRTLKAVHRKPKPADKLKQPQLITNVVI
jgi:hypothetical protein